jgi:uncharacterized delta-60 repeat protein
MLRRFVLLAPLAFAAGVIGACNALTGAGDLRVEPCPECDPVTGQLLDGGAGSDARFDGNTRFEGGFGDGPELPKPGGTLDPTFGTNGVMTSALLDTVTSVVVRADGKIVVAGASGGQLAVARFDASGMPDASFGGNGRVVVVAGTSSRADAVALDATGRILAAGFATSVDAMGTTLKYAYVVRIGETALDASFGTTGRVVGTVDGEAATCVVVRSAGDILLGGNAAVGGAPAVGAIFHIDAAGAPIDPRFDITYVPGDTSTVTAFSHTSNDLVLVGTSTSGSNVDFGVSRVLLSGFDPTFSGDGKVTVPVGSGNDEATAVGRLSNGTIIVGGQVAVPAMAGLPSRTPQFGLVALQTSGAVDTTWGTKGKATIASQQFSLFTDASDRLSAIVVDSTDRVIAIGHCDDKVQGANTHKLRGFAARVDASGRTDFFFGQSGTLSFLFQPQVEDTHVAAATAQADGKIVVAGVSSGQLGLARIIP